jgi:hypothetical protein
LDFLPLFNPSRNSAIAVSIIKPNPVRQKICQIIGKQVKKKEIAPHIADMGNARNMPRMKNAKYFKQVAVIFSMDNLKKI